MDLSFDMIVIFFITFSILSNFSQFCIQHFQIFPYVVYFFDGRGGVVYFIVASSKIIIL